VGRTAPVPHETLTFTIAGGKFTRLVENHSDQAAHDAFWS
jgi:hypothetical protein